MKINFSKLGHCLDGYRGSPLIECTRPECTKNDDCPNNLACRNEKCESPCSPSPCAPSAICYVNRHEARCKKSSQLLKYLNNNFLSLTLGECPTGYTGRKLLKPLVEFFLQNIFLIFRSHDIVHSN